MSRENDSTENIIERAARLAAYIDEKVTQETSQLERETCEVEKIVKAMLALYPQLSYQNWEKGKLVRHSSRLTPILGAYDSVDFSYLDLKCLVLTSEGELVVLTYHVKVDTPHGYERHDFNALTEVQYSSTKQVDRYEYTWREFLKVDAETFSPEMVKKEFDSKLWFMEKYVFKTVQ